MSHHKEVNCPECGQTIGLNVREESLDKLIEVTCPICAKSFQTTIPSCPDANEESSPGEEEPVTAEEIRHLEPFLETLCNAMNNAISTNPEVLDAIRKIQEEGFGFALLMNGIVGRTIGRDAFPGMHEPTPLVKNGKVVPGTLTAKDKKFMKDLRIEF